MAWDDIIYVILLCLVIGVGFYIRQLENVWLKQWVSTLVGLALVLVVSGYNIFYPLFFTVANTVILLYVDRRYNYNVAFVFGFLYLSFFRSAHLFGFGELGSHLNAIEMMHTLKMIGLAFEMRDTRQKEEMGDEKSLELKYTGTKPTFFDIFHYSFCHVGLLAGPYFKYRTYDDWIKLRYSVVAPTTDMVFKRIRMVLVYAVAYLVGNYLYPLQYVEDEIYYHSYWYRWWYMTPLFFVFRMRLYIAFILSECSCISSGLGVYPAAAMSKPGQGPTDYTALEQTANLSDEELKQVEFNHQTVYNINEYGSETVATVREGMKCWNMTVQYWLAMYVYKRVKKFRVAITMLTSAVWHGTYAGYYLCLLSVPFVLMAEDSMGRALRRNASPSGKKVYDWICWVFKMQAFAYMGMAFYLLEIGKTLKFWKSLYFSGHILFVVFFLLGHLIRKLRPSSPSNETIKSAPVATVNSKPQEKVN